MREASGVPSSAYVVSTAAQDLLPRLKAAWQYRNLLYFLVWREIKVRYKQALIGAGWAIIQPCLTMLIFTVVFGYFARLPSDGLPYPLFAFTALLPWTYFADAVRRSSLSLVEDGELVRKIYFPRLIIPLAMVAAPLVDLALSSFALIGLFAWYGMVPTANIVFLPAFVLLALGLAFAVALWLGPLNVRFRDIKHVVPFLIQIWMYASPLIYPVSLVPERFKVIYSLNPLVGIIEGFRWALLGTTSPDFTAIGIGIALTGALLAGGLVYFGRMERVFADVI
ncbi:MAG: ABC transporter permease [Rhodospirillales bacterium]|nr:ABC transporter permease [Rhodospirillales bacterium]